jgi:hypothetical protein
MRCQDFSPLPRRKGFSMNRRFGVPALAGPELHTDFKLDADGEYLALVMPNGATVASQYAPLFPRQRSDVSYGLDEQTGARLFFSNPTPGWANDVNSAGFAETPRFSIDGGVYTNNSLSLALSVGSPKDVIHYTLNATEPTEASPVYSAPIVPNVSTVEKATTCQMTPTETLHRTRIVLSAEYVLVCSWFPLGPSVSLDESARVNSVRNHCFCLVCRVSAGRATLRRDGPYDQAWRTGHD